MSGEGEDQKQAFILFFLSEEIINIMYSMFIESLFTSPSPPRNSSKPVGSVEPRGAVTG